MHTRADEVWHKTIAALNARLTQVSLNSWLKNVEPVSISDKTLILAVSNKFLKSIIESRYNSYIYDALKEIAPEINDVQIMVADDDDIEQYRSQMSHLETGTSADMDNMPTILQNDTLNPNTPLKHL